MRTPRVSGVSTALLVFADIIDSSRFSSVLGISEYGKRLLQFQQLFKSLGQRYFPSPQDRALDFSQVDARGDEGVVFVLSGDPLKRRDLVFRAIVFLYHLKGLMYLGVERSAEQKGELGPVRMGLGAGIHCGEVAYSTELKGNRSEIVQIDGFAINKAKRVESASRLGKYSRILLSREAAKPLEGEPILLSHIIAPMKGIDEKADVYEVQSGLFSELRLNGSKHDQDLTNLSKDFARAPDKIDEVWLKSLIVSILEVMHQKALAAIHKREYYSNQLKLAWSSTIEEDPILLYLRAKDSQENNKYTQQIRYLKKILDRNPEFVFAKKRMVEACWRVTEESKLSSDRIYASTYLHKSE